MRTCTGLRSAALVAVAAMALTTAACGSNTGKPSIPAGLGVKTATAGGVDVTVTPKRLDAGGGEFALRLDSQDAALAGSYTLSTLTVDGTVWPTQGWSGSGTGGQHRSGTLTFLASGPVRGAVVLRLKGLPEPITFQWQVATG